MRLFFTMLVLFLVVALSGLILPACASTNGTPGFPLSHSRQNQIEIINSTVNTTLHIRMEERGEMTVGRVLSPGQTMLYNRQTPVSPRVGADMERLETVLTAHVIGYDRKTGQPVGRAERRLLEGETGQVTWRVRRSDLNLPPPSGKG